MKTAFQHYELCGIPSLQRVGPKEIMPHSLLILGLQSSTLRHGLVVPFRRFTLCREISRLCGNVESGTATSGALRPSSTEIGRKLMSAKLSVEDVVANLEARAAFHGEQEALHAQQEVHHREQRAVHAEELGKVRLHLETFRAAAAPALELARIPVVPPPSPPPPEPLPASGRVMVSKLVRQVVQSQPNGEPFGAIAVAAEVNRRYHTT